MWHLRGSRTSRTSRTSRYYAWTWAQDKLGGGQKAKRASSARDHLMESCELWEAALKKCVEYHALCCLPSQRSAGSQPAIMTFNATPRWQCCETGILTCRLFALPSPPCSPVCFDRAQRDHAGGRHHGVPAPHRAPPRLSDDRVVRQVRLDSLATHGRPCPTPSAAAPALQLACPHCACPLDAHRTSFIPLLHLTCPTAATATNCTQQHLLRERLADTAGASAA